MSSSIQDFYKNQTIFITGGTGFVGKVLIEKLLRTCQVAEIVVLLRPKRGKTVEERFEQMFSYPCFDRLKSENIDIKSKIRFVSGDCFEEKLGLSESDRNYLIENVDIVVHSAADVKFDRHLKFAAYSNVRAVRDVLELAKSIKNLKSFVHVSTAFSQVHQKHIKEEFYEPGMSAEALLETVDALDENTLNILTPRLISKWINTYIYTKAIAEDLVRREGKNLPVAIVRPSLRSVREPLEGWVDNFYGPIGFLTGIYVGLIRTVRINLDKSSEFAPVDYVCNLILAMGWKTHQERHRNSQIQIYNFAGSNDNIETWGQAVGELDWFMTEYPSNKTLWNPIYFITQYRYIYIVMTFLLHTIPSFFMDLGLFVIGKKPQAIRGYQKFHRLAEMTEDFRMNIWTWDDGKWKSLWKSLSENDKRMFNFDFDALDWHEYARISATGARVYLVKDPIGTMDAARRKRKILKVVHYVLVVMLLYAFWRFFGYVLVKDVYWRTSSYLERL